MEFLLLRLTPIPLKQVVPEHEEVENVLRADKITVHIVALEWIPMRPTLLVFFESFRTTYLVVLAAFSRV